MPEIITAIKRTMKAPQKSPNLNVVQGDCCLPKAEKSKIRMNSKFIYNFTFFENLPRGGTLNRFIALWRSPPSKFSIKVVSVSAKKRKCTHLTKFFRKKYTGNGSLSFCYLIWVCRYLCWYEKMLIPHFLFSIYHRYLFLDFYHIFWEFFGSQ